MSENVESQKLVQDVFRITGKVLPDDDPLTLAALFYASTLREAANDASAQIVSGASGAATELVAVAKLAAGASSAAADAFQRTAGNMEASSRTALEAIQLATKQSSATSAAAARQAAEDRRALADAVEARMRKCVTLASRTHSTDGSRLVPAWYAFASFFAGAAVLAASAWAICGINSSTIHELQVGRQLSKSWQYFDAGLRKRLLEEMDKDRR